MRRREFIGGALRAAAAGSLAGCAAPRALREVAEPNRPGGLKLRFVGTGAADWQWKCDARGEFRRWTSTLFDDAVLVDFRLCAQDMLPKGVRPEVIFYTHSHGDHYSAADAVALGVKRVYCSETWADGARGELTAAAAKVGAEPPDVVQLAIGQRVSVGNLAFTALPASHLTHRANEQALIYLIEKGDVRLLYATDTGGIPGRAARLAGIDAHAKGEGVTALVMEATMGVAHEDDYRMFVHSSVADVAKVVRVLTKVGRYRPHAPDQKVYVTHMARTLHGTQLECEAAFPAPLAPAFDGLEVVFNA